MKENKNKIKTLQKNVDIFYDNYVKLIVEGKITNFQSFFMSTSLFNTEVFRTSQEALAKSYANAKKNKLGVADFNKCVNEMKSYYNIPKSSSLIYKKIDYSSKFNEKVVNMVNGKYAGVSLFYHFYNPQNGQKLDMSLCSQKTIVYMPLGKKIDLSKPPYKELYEKFKVDFFNKSDQFYQDRCIVYRQNNTDIPVNIRRFKVFPNITNKCGDNCRYNGLTNDSMIECACYINNDPLIQQFTPEKQSIIDQTNLNIISCEVKVLF